MTMRVTERGPDEFIPALPDLLRIYVEAMAYPPQTGVARAPLWLTHARRPGFRCVVAVDIDDVIHGFGYGYRGAPGQWWHDEVVRGLRGTGRAMPTDYFELTELHVAPASQGGGTGERMLRALVARTTAPRVLLSTPEGRSRAWRLYRRLGFTDVLRDFLFTGDARPFAVLGRGLPLPSSDAEDRLGQ